MFRVLGIILGICILGFVGYFFYTQYTYSEGNRAGLLIKFSKKGMVFKTYEGELNLGGINTDAKMGIVNNMWPFSVKDEAVATKLMECEGKPVTLHYHQIMKSFPWEGETVYFVDKVEMR